MKGGIYWATFWREYICRKKQQVIFCQGEPEMKKMLDNWL